MSFVNDWNTIIRDKIFPDTTLKTLMKLPQNTTIIDFIDKYFIKAGYTNQILSNEDVRIIYSDNMAGETDVPEVRRNMLTFDIYVKTTELHNVNNDRLQFRTLLIANRLIELLTNEKYMNGYRFRVAGDWDLGTRTIGYARYCVSFYYMKVY